MWKAIGNKLEKKYIDILKLVPASGAARAAAERAAGPLRALARGVGRGRGAHGAGRRRPAQARRRRAPGTHRYVHTVQITF